MNKIIKISKKFKIPIVEDASCNFAKNNNKLAGKFGSFGCFSLHPLKNLNVWGDGGSLCANKKLYNKMKLLRNHGLVTEIKIYFSDIIQDLILSRLLLRLIC